MAFRLAHRLFKHNLAIKFYLRLYQLEPHQTVQIIETLRTSYYVMQSNLIDNPGAIINVIPRFVVLFLFW